MVPYILYFTVGAPHTPSLLLVDDELYMVSDKGVASCLDARSGKVHWRERIGVNFSASPVYADGKIYLSARDGKVTVVEVEEIVPEGTFDPDCIHTPGIYVDRVVLSTINEKRIEKLTTRPREAA